ncbi:MAG: LytTR family DNA-binding domain-containing protein [Bacteroidota bacterium]
MKIKTLIVDDEPHAVDVIEKYLKNFTELEVVGTCGNAIEAFQMLQQHNIGLMFLDIKMPGLLGTDLVKSLKNPPKIIFTTAYQDYALEGFDLNAVDYLLKPISFDRFLRAIGKVLDLYRAGTTNPTISEPFVEQKGEIFIHLRVDRKTIKINVADIYWIESLKDYIKVVLKDKTLISKQKISILEKLLPEDRFVRIHRSYIVAMDKIESYQSYAIDVLGKEIPIGRNYKQECQKRFKVEL